MENIAGPAYLSPVKSLDPPGRLPWPGGFKERQEGYLLGVILGGPHMKDNKNNLLSPTMRGVITAFQVGPCIGTILFKARHNSKRFLLPGRRGKVSDPKSYSSYLVSLLLPCPLRLFPAWQRSESGGHSPQLSSLQTLQWLPFTQGRSPRPHIGRHTFA